MNCLVIKNNSKKTKKQNFVRKKDFQLVVLCYDMLLIGEVTTYNESFMTTNTTN